VISDQRLLSLDALEIPYVTIERALDRPEHSRWVAGDTIAGTRKALDHLGATGAERIALLTLRHAWAWLAETEQSYRDWCTERGREPIVIDITGRLRADTRLSIDDSLARGLADVDGLFTASDRCAVAAASALHAEGRQVGRDVVLACGVDSRSAQEHRPSITALELQPRALAEAAVTLLLSGGDTPVVLVPELNVRASSGGRAPT
jgi:DNA-binding LacI/PurR family transcriptional regulator